MRERRSTTKREFEGLFKEETAEDHEVVAVAELGLHYLRGIHLCTVHVDDTLRFSSCHVGICQFGSVSS